MRVKIKNFQSLKDLSLEVKGLTVITGPNNTGKSAVARAIMGLFTNARGNSFVRIGEKSTTVTVEIDDRKITWEKGKSVNRYEIDGLEINKVGSGPPDELKDLKIMSTEVDGRVMWPQFARQFEQIFLIDLPPSALSHALSDVENINQLVKAGVLAKGELKDLKGKLKTKREDVEIENGRLRAFEGLSQGDVLVKKAETLKDDLERSERRLERLSALSKDLDRLNNMIKSLSEVSEIDLSNVSDLSPLQSKISNLLDLNKRRRRLILIEGMTETGLSSLPEIKSLKDDQSSKINHLKSLSSKMKSLKDLPSSEILPEITEISLEGYREKIDLLERARKLRLGLKLGEEQSRSLTLELDQITEQIKESDCPLCGVALCKDSHG